jgi:dienelactone hydrolase
MVSDAVPTFTLLPRLACLAERNCLMKRLLLPAMLICGSLSALSQESVSLDYKALDGAKKQVEALIFEPAETSSKAAVVLLHGAGGWKAERMRQYAEFFQKNGIVALELRMFEARPENPQKHLAQVFGAINHLAKRADVGPENVSLMGTSYGGALSLYAATQWAREKYAENGVQLKSAAALYPTCFFHEGIAKKDSRISSRMEGFGFPADFYKSWTNIPIHIHVGDRDDFEDRDPKSCDNFVQALNDEAQKKNITVFVHKGATHGWDDKKMVSFQDPLACKWRGCRNTNESNPELTVQVKGELLRFFIETNGNIK